jgi:hypothetical protein
MPSTAWEESLTYFCYVYSEDSSTPHMEALPSNTLYSAKTQSSRMLVERPRGVRAELFDEERCVATISPGEAAERLSG